jgi:hypothetical protein
MQPATTGIVGPDQPEVWLAGLTSDLPWSDIRYGNRQRQSGGTVMVMFMQAT